jgi:predicted dehydrogenase
MIRFAAIGLDHRHIYHLIGDLIAAGAECAGYCPQTTDPRVLEGVRERFPSLKPVERARLMDDPSIQAIVCAAVPCDRAGIAIDAMRRGKDVMVDKPGITTESDLAVVRQCVKETGRIFSICFSERFVVPSMELISKLLADGAIGRVVQTVGLGPHRLNRTIRPAWFFDTSTYGGILADISSHQIDQFLFFTGSREAEIVSASVANYALPDYPAFEDFGEVLLRSDKATAYIRNDWFTPDGLPTWGDGRLFLLGTEGYIEARKYVDIAGRPGTDHVFIADKTGTRYLDGSKEKLTYFARFIADVRDRTATAMPQEHVFEVTRLALEAQRVAKRLTVPAP